MNIPRPEHPNPQWERESWRNLNGEWEFDFDFGNSAVERELYKKGALSKKITVPFCPESELSGIGYKDFISGVCYRKVISLCASEVSGKVFLNFGAVDFKSRVYVNGEFADEHIGGYSSFSVDISQFVKVGENEIFVAVSDNVRSRQQPAGKQSSKYFSQGCSYTRTTGIWQTVWLEFIPDEYIKSCKYYPDIANGKLSVDGEVSGSGNLELSAYYEGKKVGSVSLEAKGFFNAELFLSELHLWEVDCGRLYDLELKFKNDRVKSYFGMRTVAIEGNKFMLNGKPLFLRTVLDQGFHIDGIYTARDDEALKKDIELSKAFGFNGARLHQKVFEKRFIYHCDKAGYLIWGEHANWGMEHTDSVAQGNFICEWSEIIERDFNSPALIGWCPFNETWDYKEGINDYRFIESVYRMTKLFDKTRPCIDVSGNYHIRKREIFDVHDYEQDPLKFEKCFSKIDRGILNDQIERRKENAQKYVKGEPVFISEYGGIRWARESDGGWGYGNAPKTVEEFVERYTKLTEAIIDNPYVLGLCYTQLYDVEQEVNGLYYYDRSPKFDEETVTKLRKVMEKKAAIEK